MASIIQALKISRFQSKIDELITVVFRAIPRPQGGEGQINQILFIVVGQKAEGLINNFIEHRFDEFFAARS